MNKEIEAKLEALELALETIRGATLDIQNIRAEIVDIMNGTTGDELFKK